MNNFYHLIKRIDIIKVAKLYEIFKINYNTWDEILNAAWNMNNMSHLIIISIIIYLPIKKKYVEELLVYSFNSSQKYYNLNTGHSN